MSKIAICKTDNLSKEQWLKLRKAGIGGSDAAAACGLSKWKSPFALYVDKTTDTVTEEENNEYLTWGTLLEPVIRKHFSEITGLEVVEVPVMFKSSEAEFLIADIDGIVTEKDGSKSLLEIKTTSEYGADDWKTGIPLSYFIQIQHYLNVLELPAAYIAVLIGGHHFEYKRIERDDAAIKQIVALETDFWINHVIANIPPEVDSKSGDALNMLYPESNDTSIILPESADELVMYLNDINGLEAEMKERKTEYENKLKQLLGNAQCGKTPNGVSVRWKSSTSSRFDANAFKKDHPELAAKYMKECSYRRFSISMPKDK